MIKYWKFFELSPQYPHKDQHLTFLDSDLPPPPPLQLFGPLVLFPLDDVSNRCLRRSFYFQNFRLSGPAHLRRFLKLGCIPGLLLLLNLRPQNSILPRRKTIPVPFPVLLPFYSYGFILGIDQKRPTATSIRSERFFEPFCPSFI